ncbi:ribosomal-processing cysteine protease Prp [bacterium C-53]|nr:ribosomal-processing cysteine protease Prp [Lachnospiraceae bacterium]NBI01878.1 ribosomal-processing cysteine protease Prp [Lachnospiraceae bacterium]RKJ12284.1 ribosomal-processing cysteine protease Prp [bacterium C-53]
MITVDVYKTTDGVIEGFECLGHAGYAEEGSDIVCAAVSALVINCINSMDTLLKEPLRINQNQKTGTIKCFFKNKPSDQALLLVDSLFLGLREIEKNYGNTYIKLTF